jgi:hypothetical protein
VTSGVAGGSVQDNLRLCRRVPQKTVILRLYFGLNLRPFR